MSTSRPVTRRRALSALGVAVGAGWFSSALGRSRKPSFGCAPIQVDVTPPLGHPTIGGSWRPATGIDDPLAALGLVLLGSDRPIVQLALDWCELRNATYRRWRETLAAAAETTPDHVLLSCVHQHDAPYVDETAQAILAQAGCPRRFCEPQFAARTLARIADAVRAAVRSPRPLTHVGLGRAAVAGIASNRRVLKPDGTPFFGRYSACADPQLRAQPDGEIDPLLRSLTLYDGDSPVAVLRAYAVHPMSPYGRGIVSGDFVALARARRKRDRPQVHEIYATGCAGDVTAGKYNDGTAAVRERLTQTLYRAMIQCDESVERFSLEHLAARSLEITLPFWNTPGLAPESLRRTLADDHAPLGKRVDAALGLGSLARAAENGAVDGHRLDLQRLDVGPARIALFPAESFVRYQIAVQESAPDRFILPIGFGECAPGYIPTRQAVREGFREEHGYCWVDETAEDRIVEGMTRLMKS